MNLLEAMRLCPSLFHEPPLPDVAPSFFLLNPQDQTVPSFSTERKCSSITRLQSQKHFNRLFCEAAPVDDSECVTCAPSLHVFITTVRPGVAIGANTISTKRKITRSGLIYLSHDMSKDTRKVEDLFTRFLLILKHHDNNPYQTNLYLTSWGASLDENKAFYQIINKILLKEAFFSAIIKEALMIPEKEQETPKPRVKRNSLQLPQALSFGMYRGLPYLLDESA